MVVVLLFAGLQHACSPVSAVLPDRDSALLFAGLDRHRNHCRCRPLVVDAGIIAGAGPGGRGIGNILGRKSAHAMARATIGGAGDENVLHGSIPSKYVGLRRFGVSAAPAQLTRRRERGATFGPSPRRDLQRQMFRETMASCHCRSLARRPTCRRFAGPWLTLAMFELPRLGNGGDVCRSRRPTLQQRVAKV